MSSYLIPESAEAVHIWHDTFDLCDMHGTVNCYCSNSQNHTGYWYALGLPGCEYNSSICGPFDTEQEAYNDANNTFDLAMPDWSEQ